MDPTISYEDLEIIRQMWPGKIVIKGVQNVADSKKLIDLGVDGIVTDRADLAMDVVRSRP